MAVRAGNSLRPYPGLRKGMSSHLNENRSNIPAGAKLVFTSPLTLALSHSKKGTLPLIQLKI
jgi:hypothetical protein